MQNLKILLSSFLHIFLSHYQPLSSLIFFYSFSPFLHSSHSLPFRTYFLTPLPSKLLVYFLFNLIHAPFNSFFFSFPLYILFASFFHNLILCFQHIFLPFILIIPPLTIMSILLLTITQPPFGPNIYHQSFSKIVTPSLAISFSRTPAQIPFTSLHEFSPLLFIYDSQCNQSPHTSPS